MLEAVSGYRNTSLVGELTCQISRFFRSEAPEGLGVAVSSKPGHYMQVEFWQASSLSGEADWQMAA
jgi:hypothetical protein